MKRLCPVESLFFQKERKFSISPHAINATHTQKRERTNQHRSAGLAVAEAESFRVIVKRRINALPASKG